MKPPSKLPSRQSVLETIESLDVDSYRLLRWTENLTRVRVINSFGDSLEIHGEGEHWHFHRAMELTLFTSGRGTRFVGDGIHSFDAGDLVLLGENLPHYWHVKGASTGISLQWHLPPGHPIWVFQEAADLRECFKKAERGLRFEGRTAFNLSFYLGQMLESKGIERLSLVLCILAAIARAPPGDLSCISSQLFSVTVKSRHVDAIKSAIRHIHLNYTDRIDLGDLLSITHMSKPTFSREFKRHVGMNFTQFVQKLRIAAVCRDLADSDESIVALAYANGFSEISLFNRLFRRRMGCTPSEYRMRSRKQKTAAPDSSLPGDV